MENSEPGPRRRSAPAKILIATRKKPMRATFHKPVKTELPCPISLISHLGLDEFCFFDPQLTVEKAISDTRNICRISISKACQDLKRKSKTSKESTCYTLDLSSDIELDRFIDIPQIVKNHSLFHKHWPTKRSSNFFLSRSKVYHAFQDKYNSFPYIAYGGLTEWIHVLRGKLSVTVIEPTHLNLARYETLADEEEFIIEPGTYNQYILNTNNFFTIPAGRISIKKALKPTCALGGEILHSDFLNQLESFKRDVRRTNGRYGLERDAEIRHLYWFYTVQQVVGRKSMPLNGVDLSDTQALKVELADWSHRHRMANSRADPYTPANLYAPTGIQVSAILRDIRHKKMVRRDSPEANTCQVRDSEQKRRPASSMANLSDGMQKKVEI